MSFWPTWIGTPLQAGALAVLVAVLGLVIRWQLGLRKLKIEADLVQVEANKVTNADDADIRDHYADEVRQLRDRLDLQSRRHARAMLLVDSGFKRAAEAAERRHEICVTERDELRDDSRKLKDIVAGLIRIITQASASKAILLDSSASDYVRDAAMRIDLLFAPKELPPPEE